MVWGFQVIAPIYANVIHEKPVSSLGPNAAYLFFGAVLLLYTPLAGVGAWRSIEREAAAYALNNQGQQYPWLNAYKIAVAVICIWAMFRSLQLLLTNQ